MKRDKARRKTGYCQLCGRYQPGWTDFHHIFGGAYRGASERNGFVVELCHDCHHKLHSDEVLNLSYKQRFETTYEEAHGHDAFMEIMGRSWL